MGCITFKEKKKKEKKREDEIESQDITCIAAQLCKLQVLVPDKLHTSLHKIQLQ